MTATQPATEPTTFAGPPALHDPTRRDFGSDNYAGAHPEVLAAVAAANGGHQTSYGADVYTARLQDVLAAHFGRVVEAFPVFNGTGANVVALQAMVPRWGAAVCTEWAHINTDENAAPERVAGLKLLPVPTTDGKLTPQGLEARAGGRGDEHRAQPAVVSITQSTEVGTVYTPDEIGALADTAHALGLRVHLDGARIANAAAALGLPLRAFTSDVGVDVVSLGGTKNGALGAEAIVVLEPSAVDGLRYLRKMDMQLASKMRFVSAQLLALYDGDLWLRSAAHANAMAARLAGALAAVPGVEIALPVQANAVFAILPPGVADRVRERYWFYDWDGRPGMVRLMCSFDTTQTDVDELTASVVAAVRDLA
ncbi:threonine aldolase family protein [Actinotalea fermentans]|uniref:Threonine aldolase n=1 Tax=Actinotalea fermentans TaxID=43671 RepID=A0A511YUT3_9CELL|nr:beta-eliminating lyase-related protein [Actinotalea fermentans]KGM17467.1 threonine aldolase [Actinotalea fermentans ATCC 43279 = JCM 9966 = DSM 3133]GEN78926.1 threonine aldolase [Actinotalea fermentans]